MNPDTLDRLQAWCEHHCRSPLGSLQPVPVDGWAAVEALWPLNDAFRPLITAFRSLPYDAAFEPHADRAIDGFLETGQWGPLSLETWRVLLERHTQAIIVATLNAQAGNAPLSLPRELPKEAMTGAVVIWFLYAMKLPYPAGDRSRHEVAAPS